MTAVHETIDSFEDISERFFPPAPDSRNFTHLVSGGWVELKTRVRCWNWTMLCVGLSMLP